MEGSTIKNGDNNPLPGEMIGRISGLTKKYQDKLILSKVSFELPARKITTLTGPSGSGKTSLIRCLNGLERFDEGSIEISGISIPPLPHLIQPELLRNIRRKIGFIFQQFHLFSHLTVLKNVMSGPQYVLGKSLQDAKSIALPLLEQMGLTSTTNQYPRQLSGGQQQRVAIARALAVNPEVILFDEPTSALDLKNREEVFFLLKSLANQGKTLLIITHDLELARKGDQQLFLNSEGITKIEPS